ncbi:IclR family transcriptional regulator [Halorubrum sp. DTA98]|uniref:IclR family transcriptional regulator n=1 Tax=Halorubrum sp. DTA98 TaxID=3402163 RepID=UPI003AAEDC8F
MTEAKNPIKSTETTFRVLEALSTQRSPTVTALAEDLDLSKGTIHNHLSTLRGLGYLTKRGNEYHLGVRFSRLGTIGSERFEVYQTGTTIIDNLAQTTGECANIVVREETRGTYLHTSVGEHTPRVTIRPGDPADLLRSAGGKAILAHASKKDVSAVHTQESDGSTNVSLEDRQEELREIRQRSLSFSRGEHEPDRYGVGAPIKTPDGAVRCAVAIVGPEERLSGKVLQQDLAGLVSSAAKDIEREMIASKGD